MRAVVGVMIVSVCVCATAVARSSMLAQAAQAAPPQGQMRGGGAPPKNLQVLPKDWTAQQVQGFMRTYVTVGLGLQCNDCHLQDRSADDKPEKQTARQMMRMMFAANDLVKDIGDPAPAGTYKITCYTCHRGQRKPLTAPASGGGH